jgi:hypothetical protein
MQAAMPSALKPVTQTPATLLSTTQPASPSAYTPIEPAAILVAAPIQNPAEAILQPRSPLRSRTANLQQRGDSSLTRASAPQSVLMITTIPGADSCASSLAAALGVPVEIASSRKLGLSALRRRDYSTVIVDDSIAEADPAGTELIWKHSGLAVPLQINFAVVGCGRLGREIRAALARREQEKSLAMRAATSNLENDLKSTLAGLLLNSELALAEPSVPPQLTSKLRLMVELAGTLRRRLEQPRL